MKRRRKLLLVVNDAAQIINIVEVGKVDDSEYLSGKFGPEGNGNQRYGTTVDVLSQLVDEACLCRGNALF